jgi:hypothetical protein
VGEAQTKQLKIREEAFNKVKEKLEQRRTQIKQRMGLLPPMPDQNQPNNSIAFPERSPDALDHSCFNRQPSNDHSDSPFPPANSNLPEIFKPSIGHHPFDITDVIRLDQPAQPSRPSPVLSTKVELIPRTVS